jgi:hypothetical protein
LLHTRETSFDTFNSEKKREIKREIREREIGMLGNSKQQNMIRG